MVTTTCSSLTEAVGTSAPSLVSIRKEYGENQLCAAISIMLTDVCVFTGIREKFTELQAKSLALTLCNQCPDMTLTELKYFFELFKQGRYEQFQGYERPNAQVITRSFHEYILDMREKRNEVYSRREADELRRQQEEWKRNAVPPPPGVAERLKELTAHFRATQPKPMTPERQARIQRNIELAKQLKEQYNNEHPNS